VTTHRALDVGCSNVRKGLYTTSTPLADFDVTVGAQANGFHTILPSLWQAKQIN